MESACPKARRHGCDFGISLEKRRKRQARQPSVHCHLLIISDERIPALSHPFPPRFITLSSVAKLPTAHFSQRRTYTAYPPTCQHLPSIVVSLKHFSIGLTPPGHYGHELSPLSCWRAYLWLLQVSHSSSDHSLHDIAGKPTSL